MKTNTYTVKKDETNSHVIGPWAVVEITHTDDGTTVKETTRVLAHRENPEQADELAWVLTAQEDCRQYRIQHLINILNGASND